MIGAALPRVRRAAAGIALVRRGEIPAASTLLFWHTGGAPALWAHADELLPDPLPPCSRLLE
jgi:hypothetical protein